MRDQLRRLVRSSALRAVAKLSSGQALAAAIPIAAAPILGRLYMPADYGALATYMAIGQVLATMSTLQLHRGIIVERTERSAEHLVFVCFAAAGLVSVLSLGLGVGVYLWMADDPHYGPARAWILALPLSTFLGGCMAGILALANRRGQFGKMARLSVIPVAVTVPTSVLLGLFGWGVHGLFASYLLGQVVAIASYWHLYQSMRGAAFYRPSHQRSLAMARRHRRFVYYSLPSEIIGNLNGQLPVFALGALGALPVLGALVRARQLVGAPMTLLGSAIAAVFQQRAAAQYRETGSCRKLYNRTFILLASAGSLPTLIILLFAPDLFSLYLGPNWRPAGEIARILAPMLFAQLICSPLSSVFHFMGGQQEDLILMVAASVLVGGATLLSWLAWQSAIAVIIGFAASWSVIYTIYVVRGYKIAGGANT